MRERELDEFSSLFQRAVIPTIEVEKIEIRDVVVLADFGDLARGCGAVAAELAERFDARVSVRFLLPDASRSAEARAVLEAIPGAEHRLLEGDPRAHLHEITGKEKPSLIIAPAPFSFAGAVGEFVDTLLVATAIPTLLVRRPVEGSIFGHILAKIPDGRHDLIEQFSFAFRLCRPSGAIRLLHVVDETRLARLAEVLEVTPEVDSAAGGAGLSAAIQARMDHLLRGAVRTGAGAGFDVRSSVRVGDPFAIVKEEARDASLLIVGSQSSHREFLESRAYRLLQHVPGVPVLAL